jgi:EmrB/QacA subfamily drug resistance transporter
MKKVPFREKASYKWWVLSSLCLASVMVSLDNSILSTCLPKLSEVFQVDAAAIVWVNLVYFIMSQSLMLTLSKVGDVKGRKMVFLVGLSFFSVGLLGAALSQNLVQLILFRIVQGVGQATTYGLGIAIAAAAFPVQERGKALGVLAGATSVGLVAGPVIGGLILDVLGWRGIFYARIPFVILSLIMAAMVLEEQKREDHGSPFVFDTLGSMGLFGWLASLFLFLNLASKWGLGTGRSIFLAVIATAFFVFFLVVETRSPEPILDLSLFRKRMFTAATVSSTALTMGAATIVFLVPFYLAQGLGFSGSKMGIFMALLAIPSLVLSPLSGKVSDRIGSRFLCTMGTTILCCGLFWLRSLGASTTLIDIGIGIVLVGSGLAIFHPPNNSALVGSVPKDKLGIGSAVATTARQVGSSAAFAISATLYSAGEARHLALFQQQGVGPILAGRLASVAGFREALLVAIFVSGIAILTSLVRGPAEQKGADFGFQGK